MLRSNSNGKGKPSSAHQIHPGGRSKRTNKHKLLRHSQTNWLFTSKLGSDSALKNSVNLNISYPKTNRINHSVSFGNMNCLLMHFNPDIFQFKLNINIQIFEITSTCF